MTNFTKEMLRDGDRLTLRNGEFEYYNSKKTFGYDNDLIYMGGYAPSQDIVKVERIQVDRNVNTEQINMDTFSTFEYFAVNINNNLTYQTIWEREEVKDLIKKAKEKGLIKPHTEAPIEDVVEQPKKIEPIKLFDRTWYEGREYHPTNDDIIKNKINEIIDHINKEVS